jgi:hypothetical protein
MKRTLSVFVILLSFVAGLSQTCPRDLVLVELGTATSCTYCPGAAMGLDDMLANGCKVAVIENHGRDEFSNIYSESRNEFNNLIAFPTATFDGYFRVVGGFTDSSTYSDYLPKYNMRINTPANTCSNAGKPAGNKPAWRDEIPGEEPYASRPAGEGGEPWHLPGGIVYPDP